MEKIENTIIKADNVSKVFKLYNRRIDRLKDTFLPFKKASWYKPFHALDEISFSTGKGETVGIIGRNGSGKSTLLQIISGIMRPTSGQIDVQGRISALLELGAGFNPEYTGRENVYFNARIMGIEKSEIDTRFSDIEKFADIGHFVDQPVKTYSSGMYVRLAFSVAIHVDPDILIVDEALAVGDALFQSKCFNKFREFQEQGVTILFVTHSMDLITKYCKKALLLENGHLISYGKAKDVVDEYNRRIVGGNGSLLSHQAKEENGGEDSIERAVTSINPAALTPELQSQVSFQRNHDENRYGNGDAEIIDLGVYALNDRARHSFLHGEKYRFWMKVLFHKEISQPVYAYTIKDVKGFDITGTNTYFQEIDTGTTVKGQVVQVFFDQNMMLNAGSYVMSFGCAGFEDGKYIVFDRRYDVISFEVASLRESVGMFDLASQITVNTINDPA